MKKYILILLVVAVLASGYYFGFDHGWERAVEKNHKADEQEQESVDKKASFLIFTNGTRRVFTTSMYHNLSPDVYIEAANPAIVRVKKRGTTWGDFFATLPLELSANCIVTGTGEKFCHNPPRTLKFFLNGQQVENFLDTEIQDGDRALISYGADNETGFASQLKQVSEVSIQ